MTETAYPLQWPTGRPRTQRPKRSRFDTSSHIARLSLFNELGRMGAKNIVLSTNVELRLDGMPYASRKPPEDVGVAVYFDRNGEKLVFSCDRWDLVKDNIHAIRKTIDAIRGIERWGTGDAMEAAFTGFKALPPPSERPWREVFELNHAVTDMEAIRARYKNLASVRHPDKEGGSNELMAELNVALESAKRELTG